MSAPRDDAGQLDLFALPDHTPREGRWSAPHVTILVHFATPSDMRSFAELIGQRIPITGIVWFPEPPKATWGDAP